MAVYLQPGDCVQGPEVSLFRFGAFEVDVGRGDIRKHGLRIKLHEKSFLLLAVLLERPGEVVSREEIRHRLWPDDVFVDFDRNLYTTLNRLRLALGDSSDNPKFIQTVHRKGYRFIAPVQSIEPPPSQPPQSEHRAPSPSAAKPVPRGVPIPIAAALILIAVIAVSLLYLSGRPKSSLAAGQSAITVGVLLFENLTGDASQGYLSSGLTQEILVELTRLQPGAITVMMWPPAGNFAAAAREAADTSLVADYVVEGGVRRENELVRVTVELVEPRTGRVFWAERFTHSSSDLPASQEQLARRIAQALLSELAALASPEARSEGMKP